MVGGGRLGRAQRCGHGRRGGPVQTACPPARPLTPLDRSTSSAPPSLLPPASPPTNQRQDPLPEAPTVASLLTAGSKASELMQRSGLGLGAGGSRPTPLPSSLSLSRAAFSPRAAPGQAGDGCAAPGAGAGAPGSPLRGGVGLAQLATGRSGTPRLGGYPPTAEPQQSSLAYLAPDESLQPPRHSSTRLSISSAAGSPLAPPPAASPPPPSGSGMDAAAGAEGAVLAPSLPPPPEMPLSWVPALALSRERLDTRCPRGERAVRYRQARRELFAGFGECARWDGLVSAARRTLDEPGHAPDDSCGCEDCWLWLQRSVRG